MQLGIRQKLNIAIAGLAALTVLSNLVGGIFLNRMQVTYAQVTEANLPEVVVAMSMKAVSAELTAGAPNLAAAPDETERARTMEELGRLQGIMVQTLDLMKAGGMHPERLEAIGRTVEFLQGRIAQINRSVVARLDWSGQRQVKVAQLGRDSEAFQAAMQPLVDRAIDDLGAGRANADMATAARALMEVGAAVNRMIGLLSLAAQAPGNDDLARLQTEYAALNNVILADFDRAAAAFDVQAARNAVNLLLTYGSGSDTLFGLRRGELRTMLTATAALKQAREGAAELAGQVEQLVGSASQSAEAAAASAARQAMLALGVLTAFGALCLGAALFIGWAFVGPQVTRPVIHLTAAMRRLADRDWSVPLDETARRDEIGDMARAVDVFKTAGQENERLQREVEAGRAAFEAERQAQERVLEEAIGQIVSAATEGDLHQRIDTEPLQGVMRSLGAGVNDLLATVDRALTDLGGMVGALAQGELGHRIEAEYRGVFAQLAADSNLLGERLSDVVGRLGHSANRVREAAQEISAGSHDLAQRTEDQAASLQRTAASMEQITATVRHTANNAGQASNLAGTAREAAVTGGGVVNSAVEAMGRIEQSAQKIVDIIGLMDEIAFQTNLLALNASVEAARAGEAGKGFAVVAQEVRALAQRSAEASKDIKGLIATSGSEVREGARLVDQTGTSLRAIVEAVKKVASIIAEIAGASHEQAGGLDEINRAVAEMDEMTQRNGALVEQTTASAQAMADQARELTEIVAFFRVA